jgi:hypothetical protein
MFLGVLDSGIREARERDSFLGARRTSNRGTRKRERELQPKRKREGQTR